MQEVMNWIEQASMVFKKPRPTFFTDHKHCPECFENHVILNSFYPETISIKQLGNVGSDPMCFATTEAGLYYMPAMVRLSLETWESELYLEQFLFHLSYGEKENRLYLAANNLQREFIQGFLAWLFVEKIEYLENNHLLEPAISASKVWGE
jgi:hypothetical protein